MLNVAVIDYDCGNMFSIVRALEKFNINISLTPDSEVIARADRLILPGVGSFGEGMNKLREGGLIEPIKNFIKSGKPLLAICLGMQLLVNSSEEFGNHQGLGFIEGDTIFLKTRNNEKVPHVGWNSLWPPYGKSQGLWEDSFLRDFVPGNDVYFTHSFIVATKYPHDCLSVTRYGEVEFVSAVKKDNITGCQFHPEKSGRNGIKMLENFLFGKIP